MSDSHSWKEFWTYAIFGLVYGRDKVPFLVRVFSTFRGEASTWANHTFNVMKDGLTIIESSPGFESTRVTTWAKYSSPKHWGVLVGVVGFTDYEREQWDTFTAQMLERQYGYFSILKHAVDGFLSKIAGHDVRLARKFHTKKNPMSYNTCSWLTAWALQRAGVRVYDWLTRIVKERRSSRIRMLRQHYFDVVEPETVTPDTIFDNVFNTFTPNPTEDTSPKFIIIHEFGTRPPDLDQKVIDKIEQDAEYIQSHPEVFGIVSP